MSRKGENIYKRKDGRWEGRYKKGRKENGQLKYGYLYGPTYRDVKERLYAYKVKYQTLIQLNGESAISYEEWSARWLFRQQAQLKVSTYSTYVYKMTQYILPTIGKHSLNQLTSYSIQEMIDTWVQRGLKSTTIHVLYQIVKKSLSDAWIQNLICQTPCVNILLPKKKKTRAQALSRKEQVQLEKEAKKVPLYKGLPVLLALDAGLRIGEIAALKWENIDFDRRLIHIRKTYQRITLGIGKRKTQLILDQSKTEESSRTIPMSIMLYKYLKKWVKKSPSMFVCSKKSTPSEPRLLTHYFHTIRRKIDLVTIHFHQLRHTFATRCIEANGDVSTVSRLLGHASSKMTLEVYVDSFLDSQKSVIQKMENLKA